MYKIEAMDLKAERSMENKPHLKTLQYGDKERAWDMVAVLESQGYGQFCVEEIKEKIDNDK